MRHGHAFSRLGCSRTLSFSDLSTSKLRPDLLASSGRNDWVRAQITDNPYSDLSAIAITETDFENDSLNRISYVGPVKALMPPSLPIHS
uniref:Uncharacterized protein n=1 Tax=Candidatus Kentrum sp. MB TaxID=2138164 RepID=A0A450XL16_9GAMM|nr:MAG: hypothetical protein BECKMB1821G_GA0114241_10584 [Candidatus Kentron sp. MB]VFK32800.1 MAG: hypothetical protein BECKMB1821I_GA0114274_103631 [Candidatus Kentron sp. MB]VFK76552.1 MAG: hypothetical protein BECKMB1821H_GA0114242_106218 [Candidatus Kentron sp. MB]